MNKKLTNQESGNGVEKDSSLISHFSLRYIPQRPPFVMIDKLVYCDAERTETEFNILPDNLFVEKGFFTEMGILENIAQTCAMRLGYLNENQPIKIGMIGSVDNLEFNQAPKVGEKIETKILVTAEVFNVVMLKATVMRGDKMIASGSMKVVLTDTDSAS